MSCIDTIKCNNNEIIEDKDCSQNIILHDCNKNTLQEKLQKRNEKIKNEIIDIVIRQTNFSKEEAYEKLNACNFNFHKVIKDYINPEPKNLDDKKINIQQTIYKEIRNMMDSGERNRRFQEDLNNRLQKNKHNN